MDPIEEELKRWGGSDLMDYMQDGNVLAFVIGACGLALTIYYRKSIVRWLRVIMMTFFGTLTVLPVGFMMIGAGYYGAELLCLILGVFICYPLICWLLPIACVVCLIGAIISTGNLGESFRFLGRIFMRGLGTVPLAFAIGVMAIMLIGDFAKYWNLRDLERYVRINDTPDKDFAELVHEWEDAHLLQWGRPEDHTPIEVVYPVTE